MEKCQSCISKINSSCEKRIILLMIPKEEKQGWHYLLVKTLSTLPRGITSKIVTNFYYLNCLRSFRRENKLKCHEKVCKNKDFCWITLPTQKDNIFKFNKCIKSDKILYTIYAYPKCSIKEIDNCKKCRKVSNNEIGEHIPCVYSVSNIWAFHNTEHKCSLYRGADII